MGVEACEGPFVTVVSVDGGSISGNKLTVKTPAASPVCSQGDDSAESPTICHRYAVKPECSETSPSPTPPSERCRGGAYVTVVALGKDKKPSGENTSVVNILNEVEECLKENFPEFFPLLEQKSRKSFVSIEDLEEDVVIYRLPGERLGLGLRFEGGEDPSIPIDRLFIDSTAEASPAAKAEGSWGPLAAGDEVLAIGGHPVSLCSRQGLIDTLRESPVALTIRVRHLLTHAQKPEPLPVITEDEDDDCHQDILSVIEESLPLLQEESLRGDPWVDEILNLAKKEPLFVWTGEHEEVFPVAPPRRLNARDSLKCHRYQRPLSLHLDPPEGFADFQLRMRTQSLESLASTVMRSRSSLGHAESPLEPPLSFQDPQDEVVFGGKRLVVRSRSLVNISHEEPEDPSGPNHPEDEVEHEDAEDEAGDVELDGLVEDFVGSGFSRHEDVEVDGEGGSGSDEGLSSDSTGEDGGEVTIRIEWLHEIQEEASSVPSVDERLPTISPHSEQVQLLLSSSVVADDITSKNTIVHHNLGSGGITTRGVQDSESVNIEDQARHFTKELILRPLLLATIQLDQQREDPTIFPIKDVDRLPTLSCSSVSDQGGWTDGRSQGMDTAHDFEFLPPPTHARLPPDGHESPNNMNNNWAEQNYTPPPLPDSAPPDDDPPPLPTSGPPNVPSRTYHRHAKVEVEMEPNVMEPSIKSVKDKIALFSSSASSTVEENVDFQKLPLNNNYSHQANVSVESNCQGTLLEERRKSISRLRGLVLTDKPQMHSPLLDLPTIRSKDAPLITSIIPKVQPANKQQRTNSQTEIEIKEEPPENQNQWRVPLPKYSPAFKRRTLAPYVPPKPQPRLPEISCQQISSSAEDLTAPSPTLPNGKEERDESDKDSAVPSSPPSSLPQEITPPNSPLPEVSEEKSYDHYASGGDEPDHNGYTHAHEERTEFIQSPLQAIFDMEAQMAYVNEICDALPSPGGGDFFHKRRDSEVTVIERPIAQTKVSTNRDRETKSPGRETSTTTTTTTITSSTLTKETQMSSQWSKGTGSRRESQDSTHAPVQVQQPQSHTIADKVLPKVTGILEKKIERIIEKTSTETRTKTSSTSIPRGRNDFKSLAEKWQQISKQEKSTEQAPAATSTNKTLVKEFTPPPHARATRALSVTDIRKTFEKSEDVADSSASSNQSPREDGKGSPPELLSPPSAHFRVSSFDSTTSEESSTPGTSFMSSVPRDPYGSITSLASSTSLISPQELQQLIEEANQSLEEAGTPTHEVSVVILHREFPGGSLGITLAGGADYETKEITVHKVLSGSIADRDGRIHRGDRVLSINGYSTFKGLTHREALNLLKAPRCEVVLVVSRGRSGTNSFSTIDETMVCLDRAVEPLLNGTVVSTYENEEEHLQAWGPTKTVILHKDGAGLGFSLDGGKGSILGDKPLTIKKIFVGGPAEKSRGLCVGDLITAINGTKMSSKSRTEAWNFMKKLGDGEVRVSVRSPILS